MVNRYHRIVGWVKMVKSLSSGIPVHWSSNRSRFESFLYPRERNRSGDSNRHRPVSNPGRLCAIGAYRIRAGECRWRVPGCDSWIWPRRTFVCAVGHWFWGNGNRKGCEREHCIPIDGLRNEQVHQLGIHGFDVAGVVVP
jgi:hypothetical protein